MSIRHEILNIIDSFSDQLTNQVYRELVDSLSLAGKVASKFIEIKGHLVERGPSRAPREFIRILEVHSPGTSPRHVLDLNNSSIGEDIVYKITSRVYSGDIFVEQNSREIVIISDVSFFK